MNAYHIMWNCEETDKNGIKMKYYWKKQRKRFYLLLIRIENQGWEKVTKRIQIQI